MTSDYSVSNVSCQPHERSGDGGKARDWEVGAPVCWVPPRPSLVRAACNALKKAWCGAGWMESMLWRWIRPVVGENVYVEFLGDDVSARVTVRRGRMTDTSHPPSALLTRFVPWT